MRLWFGLVALVLSACGNDTGSIDYAGAPAVFAALQGKGRAAGGVTADPNDPAVRAGILALRDVLQKGGQPIILVSNASLKFGSLMAPFGGNNGVETWSSTSYQTVSLRGGVMVATRGFGPDLMSSVAPGIATIAGAKGTTQRRYSYLDGADQPQTLEFTCTLAAAGRESIEVMALSFATRKVTEACAGPAATFTNEYWFDGSTKLRQSKQFLAPGLANMMIQKVID
jgi:hypothetical protein